MARQPGVARLKDVAEAARVSVATVSRHLNGSIALPKETVERIEAAIGALHYQPNPHARSLSRGRTDTIGLVIPDIGNPFFAMLAASVEEAADAHGMGLVLCATLNRPGRELDYLERLRRNHVDGLLFVTNHGDDGSLARAIAASERVVLMDEEVPGTAVPGIFCDNDQGGALAAQHLVEAGHRRLAYIGGPPEMMSTRERLGGFRRVALAAGAEIVASHFGSYTIEHGRAAAVELLADPRGTTGIFASSDEIVLGMLEVFRGAAVRIPEDVSLVAFDDVGPLHLFGPPLTAVRQPVSEIGRRGVEMVVAAIKGRQAEGGPQGAAERLPVELIVRSSVTPPSERGRKAFPADKRRNL